MPLFVAVGDATSGEVIRSKFDLHLVSRENANVVTAHLSGDVAKHGVTILELNPEHGVRK